MVSSNHIAPLAGLLALAACSGAGENQIVSDAMNTANDMADEPGSRAPIDSYEPLSNKTKKR